MQAEIDRDPNDASGCRFLSRRADLSHARPRLAHALDVWRAQCAGAAMPPPELARFDAFMFAIGRLHLVEVRGGGRFYFRVYGSSGMQYLDYHRRETAQMQPPAFRAVVEQDFAEAVAAGAPVLHETEAAIPRRTCRYQRLMLPYGPPAGPAKLLLAVLDEENEADVAAVFRDPMFAVVADAPAVAAG